MQESRRNRSLAPVLGRALATLLLVPVIALGVATAFSSGTGPASASSAVRSNDYSGGILMAADPTGGYWTVTPAGAVTPHGGAGALGSPAVSNLRLARPIVGMTATTDGNGYWLVASDGGIFSYGDAMFYGSTGSIRLNMPIVGMAPTPGGNGYYLVGFDGGVFTFGDASFYGSTGGWGTYVYGMIINPATAGYTVVTANGQANVFGPGLNPYALWSGGLQQGAYDSTSTPSGMASFAAQTHTSPTVATVYLPGNNGWADMDGSGGTLNWLTSEWPGAATRSRWESPSSRPTRAGPPWAPWPRVRREPSTPTT